MNKRIDPNITKIIETIFVPVSPNKELNRTANIAPIIPPPISIEISPLVNKAVLLPIVDILSINLLIVV